MRTKERRRRRRREEGRSTKSSLVSLTNKKSIFSSSHQADYGSAQKQKLLGYHPETPLTLAIATQSLKTSSTKAPLSETRPRQVKRSQGRNFITVPELSNGERSTKNHDL